MHARRKSLMAAALIAMTIVGSPVSGPAFAQDAIDTTRIARLPGSKELFAFPQSTSYTTSLSVPEALTALGTLLVGDKWQPYEQAFASRTAGADLAIVQFKKDRQLLSVMITPAPAQNNATSVSYTGLVTGNDLPFPKDASSIKYDPTRPYLACISASDSETLSREMREGLRVRGWQPWSAKDAKRVEDGDQKTEKGIAAFYVHSAAPSLHLSLGKRADGQTSVTIEAVSAEVLAAAGKAAMSAPAEASPPVRRAAAEPRPDAAPRKAPDPTDGLADEIMKQARSAIGDALSGIKSPPAGKGKSEPAATDHGAPLRAMMPGEVDASLPVPLPEGSENIDSDNGQLEFSNSASVAQVAAFYRSSLNGAGWKERKTPINKPNMVVVEFDKAGANALLTIMRMGDHTQVTATGSAFKAARAEADRPDPQAQTSQSGAEASLSADQLEADEAAGLPVPKQSSSKGSEKSMFRVSAMAEVSAPLQAVLGFYRRELGKRSDWRMQSEATDTSGSARIQYATPEGPALLTLAEKSGTTSAVLLVRKQKEAQASGLMPKAGQVRILIGNVLEKDAQVSLASKTIKVGAGKGAKGADGPMLEIKPGTYTVSVKSAGLDLPPETITVVGDEIWGLMIGPGGVLPLPMY